VSLTLFLSSLTEQLHVLLSNASSMREALLSQLSQLNAQKVELDSLRALNTRGVEAEVDPKE